MDLFWLLLGALVAVLAARALSRANQPPAPPAGYLPSSRAAELCASITGNAARDRLAINGILALGAEAIPELLERLRCVVREPEGVQPALVARLEAIIADFGLAAVPAVGDLLARVRATSPLGPGLLRVLRRLGSPGAVATLRRGLDHRELAPHLPRWRLADRQTPEPGRVLVQVLADRPAEGLHRDLEILAGLLVDWPETLELLYERWDAARQLVLLEWLAEWPPLVRPGLVASALRSTAGPARLAGIRLAALMVDDRGDQTVETCLLAALREDPLGGCRAAAADALAPLRDQLQAPLLTALGDADPEVVLAAAFALWPPQADAPRGIRAQMEAALAGDPRAALVQAIGAQDELVLSALEHPDLAMRRMAVRLLERTLGQDPRARERLIRLGEVAEPDERVAAISALTRMGEPSASELLVRSLEVPVSSAVLLEAQRAARSRGQAAVLPLARRLRGDNIERARLLLSVLRALPFTAALAHLLRCLERSDNHLQVMASATLHAGGRTMRAAMFESLGQPSRGLLTPALSYLASYGTHEEVPLFLELYERHLPLRGILLNLIESHGQGALEAIAARIAQGGDDAVLLGLESRLAVLEACAADRPLDGASCPTC